MAKLPGAFNVDDVEGEMGDFPILPAGDYHITITNSEYLQTKKKDGHYLKLEYTVTSGEHAKKKLWTNLNLDNPNASAVEIAQKELKSILKAVGKVTIEDSEELHGCELTVTVGVKKGDKERDEPDRNTIKKYAPLAGAEIPGNPEKTAEKKLRKKPVFEDDED